jgi:hypothetical protein
VGCCSSCRNWVCCWVWWWREAGDFIRRIFIFILFFASAMAACVPGACECGAVVVVKGSELVAMAAIRASSSASAASSRTLASSRNLLTRRAGLLLFQQAAPQGNQQQQKKLAHWPLQLGAARLVSNAVSFASSSFSSSSSSFKHHQHHRLAVTSKLQLSRGSPELNFGGLGLWPRVQVRLFCPTELLSLFFFFFFFLCSCMYVCLSVCLSVCRRYV